MEALFKKYFWVVKGLGLAAAVGLAASALTTQMGTSFALDVSGGEAPSSDEDDADEDEDGEDKAAPGSRPFATAASKGRGSSAASSASLVTAKRRVAEDINKRNIFCPTCVPVQELPPGVDPGSSIGRGEMKSSLPLKLMATMEASKPEYSLATVFDADTSVTGLYGLGDDIRPGVVVLGIDLGIVHIRNNVQLEYIEVGADVKGSVAPTAAATAKPAPKKPSPSAIDGAEEAIKCSSENQCVVERQFVEQLMANPAMLAKQARIVPSQRDGETQGFKFYGIRRGSLPKLLGLNNGDMLTEVNGEAMTSVDQAMGLAMKLRRASNLSVTLVRKGKTITKEIQIQ